MASALRGVRMDPPARPRAGAAERMARPKSMRTRETRRAGRTPHLSARPPKKSMEMVMPEVSTPTIHPARWSSRPTYWLKYMAR